MARMAMVFVALVASGCAHYGFKLVDSSVLTNEYLVNPRVTEDVGVFIDGDVPPESCERVALLRAAPTASVVDMLREEAGKLGANVVDLRDFRNRENVRHGGREQAWNAVALHCPQGLGQSAARLD